MLVVVNQGALMKSFALRIASALVALCVTASAAPLTWDGDPATAGPQDGPGTWTASGTSWWDGTANTNWNSAAPDSATFGAGSGAAGTVTVDGTQTIGGITFDAPGSGSYTLSGGTLTLSANPAIAANVNATIGSVLAGASGFVKAGAGYLTLTAAGTETGPTTVDAGTLEVQSKAGDVAYVITNGATLKLGYSTGGGYANTFMKIYGDGVSATSGFHLAGGRNYNASGQIQLLGAPTTIRQYGTNLAGIGTFDINGTALWCSSNASGSAIDANIQMVSSGYGMSAQVDAGANTDAGDLVINGPLNVGTLGFYKRGAGSIVLNGTATAGNAAFRLHGGSAVCGAADCIGARAELQMLAGTKLVLNGFPQVVANLTGAGSIVGSSPAVTVLSVSNAGAQTFSGSIGGSGVNDNQIAFSKGGAGAMTLSGTNTYAGGTTVRSGTLILSGAAASPSAAFVTVAPGAVLDVTGLAGTFALGAGQPLTAGRGSASPATDINGSLNCAGPIHVAGAGVGTMTVDGDLMLDGATIHMDLTSPAAADLIALGGSSSFALTLTGTTTIQPAGGSVANGTYTLIDNVGSISGSGDLVLGTVSTNRGTPIASFSVAPPAVTMTISGVTPISLVWTGSVSGVWDEGLTANANWLAGLSSENFFNLDSVAFYDDPVTADVNVTTNVYPSSLTISNNATAYTIGGAGAIGGGGGLTKSGTNSVFLTGTNSYSGGTTIHTGLVRLGSSSAIGAGDLTLNGGTLDLNRGSPSVGSLSGTGGTITDQSTEGSAVTDTLTVNQGGSNTFSGLINNGASNTLALIKNGPGHLTLSAASTFRGGVSVNAGTLDVLNKSGDVTYNVASGATLRLGYSTGGGYANTYMAIHGSGAASTAGFHLLGGRNYNGSGQIQLLDAPTTIRQYGTNFAGIGIFDINYNAIWCSAAASGSVIDPNIQMISYGYGMSVQVDAGANTATGDLVINGPLNVNAGIYGFYKRGGGSLVLNAEGTPANSALQLQGGTAICGTGNCIGVNANLPISAGARLVLNGFSQRVVNLWGSGSIVGSSPAMATLTISNTGPQTYSGVIGGPGTNDNQVSFAKGGTNTMTLTGTNTYAGDTVVSSGALVLTNGGALYHGAYQPTAILTLGGGALLDLDNWDYSEAGAASLGGLRPDSGALLIDGGTVRVRTTSSSARGFTIGTAGVTFDAGSGAVWTVGLLTNDASADIVSTNGGNLMLMGPGDGILAKAFPGSGSLTKDGTGSWALTASNSYSGFTTILDGKLAVDGWVGSGSVVVASPATLAGCGTIGGAVECGGILSPGALASAGRMAVDSLTLYPGSKLSIELGGTAQGTEYDAVSVQGSASLDGDLDVVFIDGFETAVAPGDTFAVVQAGSPISGAFANVAPGGTLTVGAQAFKVYYGDVPFGGDASAVMLEAVASAEDGDNDGLNDAEETGVYGTNPGLFDTDGDGVGDGDEVVAGSNPLDADSIGYRITQEQKAGGSVVIRWASTTNRMYDVLSTTILFGPQIWTPVSTIPSGGATTGYTNASPGAAEFYQIKARVP
jgi:autotransporter-associated beta strand protein